MAYRLKPLNPKHLLLMAILLVLGACTALGAFELNQRFGTPMPQQRQITNQETARFFEQKVAPVINSRCIACHACYDAPCQLKLDSAAGIDRGLTQTPVYSGRRLIAKTPTRLFIDAQTTQQWRNKGFEPVLNERQQSPSANLQASVLYQVLALKAKHPLPDTKVLDEDTFNFSTKRDNQCPSIEAFDRYAASNPLAGMPYGFPGLTTEELGTLTQWIEDGAPLPAQPPLPASVNQQVQEWERFLNQPDNKGQLVSRYLYEHLFLANLYFSDNAVPPSERHYFKLVRSRTAPGNPIDMIATRRPGDNPNVDRVYYRLQAQPAVVITKTHLPYALNSERKQWLTGLFFKPDYHVTSLPGYRRENFNPFSTYRDIPASARYRFLLHDAHYYIAGFIKGPVCRGQIAVGVINDQFWVFFVDPDTYAQPMADGFIEQQIPNLRLPGEEGSNGNLLSYWTTYSELHRKYLLAKADALNKLFSTQPINLDLIWDGDGKNTNAALTIFRNFDDASVTKGLIGEPPKTAWVIDYPLLERIHYLLTADFDVFGNVAHQLNTRLYMDFLRIEGEYNFLSLLPKDTRIELRDFWYRGASQRLHDQLYRYKLETLPNPNIVFHTNAPKRELYQLLSQHLGPAVSDAQNLSNPAVPDHHRKAFEKLQKVRGIPASLLAEMSVILVKKADGRKTLYTMLANRAHLNITSLLFEQDNRLPEEDAISVAYGILGDYPNTFFVVNEENLNDWVNQISTLATADDYARLLDNYGIRRTNKDFWWYSDQIHAQYVQQQPEQAGWMDYNRYENR